MIDEAYLYMFSTEEKYKILITVVEQVMSQLNLYSQRLTFANGRIRMLKGVALGPIVYTSGPWMSSH